MQHDPAVEKFLADIFPTDVLDFDPESAGIPISELQIDSDNPQDGSFRPQSISVPPIEQVLPEARRDGCLPEAIQAIYMLQHQLAHSHVSAIEFYSMVRAREPLLHAALPPRAHVDGGAMGATAATLLYLWYYRPLTSEELAVIPRFKVADGSLHLPVGVGFLKVPLQPPYSFVFVKTYYTPGIPATIISPHAMATALGCQGYTAVSDLVGDTSSLHLTECTACDSDVVMSLTRISGLSHADSLIAPTPEEHASPIPTSLMTAGTNVTDTVLAPRLPVVETVDDDADCVKTISEVSTVASTVDPESDIESDMPYCRPCTSSASVESSSTMGKCNSCVDSEPCATCTPWRSTVIGAEDVRRYCTDHIRQLSVEQQRTLWHMRMNHVNHHRVAEAHKFADGVPKLRQHDVLTSCPLCTRAKLHKASRQPEDTKVDLESANCFDHIQIDFGFIVQRSSRQGNSTKKKKKQKKPPPPGVDVAKEYDPDDPDQLDTVPDFLNLGVNVLTRAQREAIADAARASQNHPSSSFDDVDDASVHEPPEQASAHAAAPGWFDVEVAQPPAQPPAATVPQPTEAPGWFDVEVAQPRKALRPSRKDDSRPYREEDPRDRSLPPPARRVAGSRRSETAQARYRRLVGLNGETCYVLITDRKSGAMKVSIRRDKSPPVDFFKRFISRYGSSNPNRTVRFDQGGELGRCVEVHEIFETAGYTVEVTGTDSSSEIGAVERPHRYIADGVRTMLLAAGLPLKFWPYALAHFILVANCIPRGDRDKPPITICTGIRPDLRLLRVFGCRIFALPPGDRPSKLDVHARQGVFLGFKDTFRHAYYYDFDSGQVKIARHVAFDETSGFHHEAPPYVEHLRKAGVKDADLSAEEPDKIILEDEQVFGIHFSPFEEVTTVDVPFDPSSDTPFGFEVVPCQKFLRAFAHNITCTDRVGEFTAQTFRRKFQGSYILRVGDTDVFSQADVLQATEALRALPDPPTTVPITFAHDFKGSLKDTRGTPLHLRAVDIRRVAALHAVAGEGLTPQEHREQVRELAAAPSVGYTPADPDDLVLWSPDDALLMQRLQNDHMTDEERQLKSFSRKNLMKLSNWEQWREADETQLNAHFDSGTIGKAVPRPSADTYGALFHILRLVWNRLIKPSGVRKSRACIDGSKRAAPWLRHLVQTHSSCIEFPCLRLFFAICASKGYIVGFGDVNNAYQQSPPPSVDCFIEIDDTVEDWYFRRFGVRLNRFKEVIPLLRALQGHPEAGVLWERMITDILINKMGFKNTTHERNLYVGRVDDHEVLVCRQVDDFASGSPSMAGNQRFFDLLREHVATEFNAMGVEIPTGGYFERYNGVDVIQTRDYIKLSCETYIDRMLLTHGWSSPKAKDPENLVPVRPEVTERLMKLEGPKEKTPDAIALSQKHGFSYRNVLGELIFAYVVCRVDIGFSVCFLARFSDSPHDEHYRALVSVCRYLRKHKDWGIIYRRPSPVMELPPGSFTFLPPDPDLPPFPPMDYDRLLSLYDAAHATELLKRRSVTGVMIFFCLAVIAYKSRLQDVTATSSTEAEFYAGVVCAKMTRYFRHILDELDLLLPGPTLVYTDNLANVHIVNERRPTPRTRHVETQHFAVQDWRKNEELKWQHFSGKINPSDDLTKALAWSLHGRHGHRAMGHYGPDDRSLQHYGVASLQFTEQGREYEAGEGVRAQIP